MGFDHLTIRFLAACIFGYSIALIHNNRLRIGYSWFLLMLATGLLLLTLWPASLSVLQVITESSSLVVNLLFMLALFLLAITIHTSIINSELTTRVKELSQEITLLKSEVADMHFPYNSVSAGRLCSVHQIGAIKKHLVESFDQPAASEGNGTAKEH